MGALGPQNGSDGGITPLGPKPGFDIDWGLLEKDLAHVMNMRGVDASFNIPDYELAKMLSGVLVYWLKKKRGEQGVCVNQI